VKQSIFLVLWGISHTVVASHHLPCSNRWSS
jgi:hypothetical protein